jgi:hypothetical protein
MTVLDEQELGAFIGAHHNLRGDALFRMERLPLYDVPSQTKAREAWVRTGTFDTTGLERFAGELAEDEANGLTFERVRVLSADLTDDEAMSCNIALPILARHSSVRVLHRGEHPVPELRGHDYWITYTAATDETNVVAMHYSDGGAFVGAEVVPAELHGPYLRERALAWSIGEPFTQWWARHGELHRRLAA